MPSTINITKFLGKKDLLLVCLGNSMAHCGHTAKLLIEGKREREGPGLGFSFYWDWRWALEFHGFIFYWWILHKWQSQAQKEREKKKRKKEKTAQIAVVMLMVILSVDGNVFTRDSFLCTGCLSNQSLSQAFESSQGKKKKSGQGLHYIYKNKYKYITCIQQKFCVCVWKT